MDEKISLYDLSSSEGYLLDTLFSMKLISNHDSHLGLSIWSITNSFLRTLNRYQLINSNDYWQW